LTSKIALSDPSTAARQEESDFSEEEEEGETSEESEDEVDTEAVARLERALEEARKKLAAAARKKKAKKSSSEGQVLGGAPGNDEPAPAPVDGSQGSVPATSRLRSRAAYGATNGQ
jgi:hypothetical protein